MPPTLRDFDSFAASTFLALIEDIIAKSALVSIGECHATSEGLSSIRSANETFRLATLGRDHQTQFFFICVGTFSYAATKPRVCHACDGPVTVRPAGIAISLRKPMTKRREAE